MVPYGVDARFSQADRPSHDGPLRVLSVGDAGLRKGIPYAAETARLLGRTAEFRWIGPVGLLPDARSLVEPYVEMTGAIPRNLILPHFEWADVFFLPSVCEGSATVTYEALMSGLPVIATPNTGSIVTDGVNGFIVPTRDTQAMADCLRRLHLNRGLLSKMQEAARHSVEIASLEAYERRLLHVCSGGLMRMFIDGRILQRLCTGVYDQLEGKANLCRRRCGIHCANAKNSAGDTDWQQAAAYLFDNFAASESMG